MSLLLFRIVKPTLVRRRSSLLRLLCNGFSSSFSSSLKQTPPCAIICAEPCGSGLGKLKVIYFNELKCTELEKKVPLELFEGEDALATNIGSSHGWLATLKKDGIIRLQDDLNPVASDTNPKRISLPPLVTLPHCQTQIVTNIAMSSSSPEDDEDCVVAVKFLGPQLSFCRPALPNPEWINIRIKNPCFHSSSRVMFSKKDDMFCLPGSGGHIIGSWDLNKHKDKPKIQRLRFKNLPKLSKTKRNVMDCCCTSEHLVESRTTNETFLVKQYKKAICKSISKMETIAIMVFKLDEEGNAVYTQDIGDLCIFISKSEPFCVRDSSFSDMYSKNNVNILDFDEIGHTNLHNFSVNSWSATYNAPYHIPPQTII